MKSSHLCPSAPLYPGSRLLGVVKGGHEVDILEHPLELDEVFVEVAGKGKAPEEKFRFVNKCVKSGCAQWNEGSCGVIKRVLATMEEKASASLPDCSIRPQCRWFSQEGAQACGACTKVKYV